MTRTKWYKVWLALLTLAVVAFPTSMVFADSSMPAPCALPSRSDLQSVLPSQFDDQNTSTSPVCSTSPSSSVNTLGQLANQSNTGDGFIAGWNYPSAALQASIPVTGARSFQSPGNISDVLRDASASGLPAGLQASPAASSSIDVWRDAGAGGFLSSRPQSSLGRNQPIGMRRHRIGARAR
jgi:hypothetical protein